MTTLGIYSNKGGVGKTTTAVNLAYLASLSGRSTLICDLDPQSSTTYYFRVKPKLKKKARGFMRWRIQIDASIKGTDYMNLDLLPADISHRNLDITFGRLRRRKYRLNIILKHLRKEYDLIILDCPPTINIVAENVFNATDYLLVPLIPTMLSARTHAQLLTFLKRNGYSAKKVYGFFSMLDNRKKMHRKMTSVIRNEFNRILRNPISYYSLIEKMDIYREPVPAYAPDSAASKAYQALWEEIRGKLLKE